MSVSSRINHYANSMFRFEELHEAWLLSCQQYLVHLFGDHGMEGRVVVDYGFGRGNWAVAFARCGAARVIAIDASYDNCRRLSEYCRQNRIANIEVICKNLSEQDIEFECDLLWLYGVLHHIPDASDFLGKLLPKVKPDGVVLAYTYNAGSLREWLVSVARRCISFDSEDEFRSHALFFTPSARMRARDDLVAPHISWDSAPAFAARFARFGWHPAAQLEDFSPWLHRAYSGEFHPYVVKFMREKQALSIVPQQDNPADLVVLRAFAELILKKLPAALRISFAVGLFNTHFQAPSSDVGAGLGYKTNAGVVWEDFKYLLYAAATLSVSRDDFEPEMKPVWDAAMHSLKGMPHHVESVVLGESQILARLGYDRLRI